MIDGGVFGVCGCGGRAHWLPPAPVRGRGQQIGCASSPAVLERRRSLQLSSVGSREPRKEPCDPSRTRPRSRIRSKPARQPPTRDRSPRRARPGYGYVYTWGESRSAKVVRGVSAGCFSLRQKLDEGFISTVGLRVSAVALFGNVFIFVVFFKS